jgi:hypothetical protein
MINLWSERWSVARGRHWVLERECADATANEWLAVFRNSEPGIRFVLAVRKPHLR